MPTIPANPALGYVGTFLLIVGIFLVAAGLNIFKITEKVQIAPGGKTLGFGAILILFGIILLGPDISRAFPPVTMPTLEPTIAHPTPTFTLSAATETPIPSPTVTVTPNSSSEYIAFASNRDGNLEIYKMRSDGFDQTRLTNSPADDGQPAWSPDAKRIAFRSNRGGHSEIYIMNADGSAVAQVTNGPNDDFYPAWAPDGQHIAYAAQRGSNVEIYTVNLDGTAQVLLGVTLSTTTDPKMNDPQWASMSWSPDDKHIAFASNRDGNLEIYAINADGTGQVRLTNNPAIDGRPSWSPDSKYIAFTSNRDGNFQIYVMRADGTSLKRLTNNLNDDSVPTWSPDGTRIAFCSNRDGNWEIYIMNADGTGQTRLTNNSATDWHPDWSPQ